MTRRLGTSEMVRGMGMGMKVLELLITESKKQGADEEVFAFLTRPRFKHNLERIGKAVAECDWRIPASEMRTLAEKAYQRDFVVDESMLEEVRNLWWYAPLQDLGIPFQGYENDPESGMYPAIPSLLLKKLHGRKMEYPLFIVTEHGKRREVVVDWGTTDDTRFASGDTIDATKIKHLSLADHRYFDFNR